MTLRLANVTFDCDDALAVARFWSAALDLPVDPDATSDFASLAAAEPTTTSWFFSSWSPRVPCLK